MERKKAIVTAAIVSGAVFAASAAIGVNVGLLSSSAESNPVGQLQVDDLAEVGTTTSTSAPEPVTVVVDEYVTDPAAAAAVGGTVAVPGAPGSPGAAPQSSGPGSVTPAPQPATSSAGRSGSTYVDDDHDDDDDEYEDEENEEEEEHEELEGHDDDD